MTNKLMMVGLVFVLAISVVGISESPKKGPTPENTYYEGWLAGAKTESSLFTGTAHRLDYYVLHPLVAINWKGELQPLLAESWEMLEGGRVWLLHLRQGVKWHDGALFTAKDVLFSFDVYVDPKVGSRRHYWLEHVVGYDEFRAGTASRLIGVTALDDFTVRVELKEPMPLWIRLYLVYIIMFPEHILGNVPREQLIGHEFWSHRIGTGPFKWVEYVEGQYILLERNEDYFLGAPQLEYLVLRFYSDAASFIAALEKGEIDALPYETAIIPLDEVERLDALPNIDVLPITTGMANFIRFNHSRPEWADVRVRQAIRYAINVEEILETLAHGYAEPAYTIFWDKWCIPDDLITYEYNPEKARQLLTEAGWDPNREVDFIYEYRDSFTLSVLQAIQSYLADVGIKIVPRRVDPGVSISLWAKGEFDAGYFGFGAHDPALLSAAFQGDLYQSGGYHNERALELFKKAASFATNAERAPYYQEIARIANEELPCVWLWYAPRPLAFNRRVWGPYEHWKEQGRIYFNMPVYNEIEKWYIKK